MSGPDSHSPSSPDHDSSLAVHFRTRHPVTVGRVLSALFLALLIAVLNFVVWDKINPVVDAPPFYGKISGLAYNSATKSWYATQNFAGYQNPTGSGLVAS